MDKNRFVYAGVPGAGGGPWQFIEDTPESRSQAIDEGYKAFTTTSFDFEPEKGKAEPYASVTCGWTSTARNRRPWQ